MFTLIKLVVDVAVVVASFIAGVKVAVAYPSFATKVNSFWAWVKSVV